LVIVDIIMPGMAGLQLFEIVRSHRNLSDIPSSLPAFVSRERDLMRPEQYSASFKPFESKLLAMIEAICGFAPKDSSQFTAKSPFQGQNILTKSIIIAITGASGAIMVCVQLRSAR
jgi:DNA-binding NtrC family response regulator